MEIKIIEEKKNKLTFELKGEGHGFCNILREELWNDSHVKNSAYRIDHPLVGVPRFIVETDGKESPKDALKKACKRLDESAKKLKKIAAKEIK